jgi:hypothetical protein
MEGETVSFTVDPDEEYSVKSVTVTSASGEVDVTLVDGTYSFVMPGEAVTITVERV